MAADILTVYNLSPATVPLARGIVLPQGKSYTLQQNDLTNNTYLGDHLAKAIKAGLISVVTFEGESLSPSRMLALTRGIHGQTHSVTPPVGDDPIPGGGGSTLDYRQLILLADGVGGPMEGFPSGAVRQTLPTGSPFPTVITWWTDATLTLKLLQKDITFDSIKRVTQIRWSLYKPDGLTVLRTVTDVITYSTVFETRRTRTVIG